MFAACLPACHRRHYTVFTVDGGDPSAEHEKRKMSGTAHKSANANDSLDDSPPHRMPHLHTINGMKTFSAFSIISHDFRLSVWPIGGIRWLKYGYAYGDWYGRMKPYGMRGLTCGCTRRWLWVNTEHSVKPLRVWLLILWLLILCALRTNVLWHRGCQWLTPIHNIESNLFANFNMHSKRDSLLLDQKDHHFGGNVAANASVASMAQSILEEIVEYLNVQREDNDKLTRWLIWWM